MNPQTLATLDLLMPETEGQADCMTVTRDAEGAEGGDTHSLGHWYSPAAVKKLLMFHTLEVLAQFSSELDPPPASCKAHLQ